MLIGLPKAKLAKAPFNYDQLAAKYMALKPGERSEQAQQDLVVLGQHGKSIRATRAEADEKTKKGFFTMVGGLGITVATGVTNGLAKNLLPPPVSLGLQIAGGAVTALGISSLMLNSHVRDFSGQEAQWENSGQQDFLRHVIRSEK